MKISRRQPCRTTFTVRKPSLSILIVSAVVLTLATSRSLAIGVRIPSQDPEAMARENAFAATADNPSAIYYNPAGISQIPGQTIQVGVLNYLGIETTYEPVSGSRSRTKFEVLPVPELYYTYGLKNAPITFGLGAYAPY